MLAETIHVIVEHADHGPENAIVGTVIALVLMAIVWGVMAWFE